MEIPLRPLTLGEILDRTAHLYRSKFLVFFGLACVPASVVLGFGGIAVLLFAWQGTAGVAPIAVAAGVGLLGLVGLPAMIAANALSGAALCQAASAHALGDTIAIRSAFRAVWRRGWQYVGLYLLLTLIIVVAPFVVFLVLFTMFAGLAAVAGNTGSSLASEALVLLVFLGLGVYAVWMLVQLCLAFPISVVEQAGVGAALKRAWQLCRGTRLRMLVLFALGMAVGWIASLMLVIPLTVVMALIPALNSPEHAQVTATISMIGIYAASFVVQALTWPVYAIALVLFYYDQRVRREGFDIELLMQRAGMEPAPPVSGVEDAWSTAEPIPDPTPASGQVNTEQVNTGQANTEQANTEQADSSAEMATNEEQRTVEGAA